MALRKRESLYPSTTPQKCSPRSRKQLQLSRNHHILERLQDVALHTLLGNLHSRDFRTDLLSTNRRLKSRILLHLKISTLEYPHCRPDSRHNRHFWSLGRHSSLTTPPIPPLFPYNHHGMLFSAIHLPQHRRCLRSNYHRFRICLIMVSNDVALASANHFSGNWFRLLDRLRELVRANWWRPRASDL